MKSGVFPFLLLFCFLSSRAVAQPLLNSCDHVFQPGDGYSGIRHQVDTTSFFPVALGANVTWNFANLITTSTVNYNVSFVAVDSTPNPGPYPGANIVELIGSTNYYYLGYQPGAATYFGVDTPFAWAIYSDPQVKYTCPLSFGGFFTDTYSATQSNASPFSGHLRGLYDGYGTLILPHATFQNAILIHTFDTLTQVASVSYRDKYYWYDGNLNIPRLIAIRYSSPTSPDDGSTVQYVEITSMILGQAKDDLAAQIQVHPNPAGTAVHVEVPAEIGLGVFRLQDLQGRTVLQSPIQIGQGQVAQPNIDPGLYVFQVCHQDGQCVKMGKLIKE